MMIVIAIPVSLLIAGLGLRVLLRARREGGVPHHMVGVFFLCMGLAAAPALLAGDPEVTPRGAETFAMAFGHTILSTGFGALAVFAWTCFGPDSAWRRLLALGLCASLAGLWIAQAVVEQFAAPGGSMVRAAALVRATALVWAFCESLRYRLMMQRRVALGLADPVVANRFLLWTLWIGGMLAAIGVAIAVRFLLPDFLVAATTAERVFVVGGFVGAALVSAFSLWLAFFPPRPYLAWLERDISP